MYLLSFLCYLIMNQSDLLLWHMICMTHTISKSAVWLTMVMYMSVGRLVYYNKMQGLYLSVGSNVFRSAFRLHDGRLNSGRSLRRPRCGALSVGLLALVSSDFLFLLAFLRHPDVRLDGYPYMTFT